MNFAILGEVGTAQSASLKAFLDSISEATWALQVEPKTALSTHPRRPSTVLVAFRFLIEADRDRLWLTIIGQVEARNPTAGSYLARHNCTHDQLTPVPCTELERRTF